MDKDTSEIAKLTERISKDPKSKLFVPLAEEYKKTGDIEMSILVLTEGLKNNPGYITARSFLGRLLIEKGDIPGAQREFEEVVKAIPDNLMAQRKLGDLYVLQDRPAEALQHYKIALALNPGDQETASLVVDVEAGRNIKARLSKSRSHAQEDHQIKQETPQAILPQAVVKPEPPPAVKQQPEPVPSPLAAAEIEEAEEILVVEPLGEPAGHDLSAEGFDFLNEAAQEPTQQIAEEEKSDALFALNEPFLTQEFSGELEKAGLEADERTAAFSDIPEEPEKQADDFTTDTLAELYISQGFFEKAVDIYERMLVDNPDSQGLKNKLAKVRAMAAESVSGLEEKTAQPGSLTASEGVLPGSEPGEMTAAAPVPDLDVYVPPVQKAKPSPSENEWSPPTTQVTSGQDSKQPRLDDWELPAAKMSPAQDEALPPPAPTHRQPQHFEVGFEPVEYVPPDAVPRQAGEKAPEISGHTLRKSPAAGRKETIDRLESWLKNIIKEK